MRMLSSPLLSPTNPRRHAVRARPPGGALRRRGETGSPDILAQVPGSAPALPCAPPPPAVVEWAHVSYLERVPLAAGVALTRHRDWRGRASVTAGPGLMVVV